MSATASLRAPAAGAVHHLWRAWLRVRFHLFQRGRHGALVLEEVAGLQILVLPEVFNPKLFWTGELLARVIADRLVAPGSAVLDLGTGTGIGALAAARRAERVVAVDINPAAVRCARINALLNGFEDRIDVRGGDLFAPVEGEQFDLVLFNPPYYPGLPRDSLERAFRASDIPRRFAHGLGAHLLSGGHALIVLSSAGDDAGFLAELRKAGFRAVAESEQRRIGEVLTVYRVEPC